MEPRPAPKRRPRLIVEIALVIACKLCIIFAFGGFSSAPSTARPLHPTRWAMRSLALLRLKYKLPPPNAN